jgi:hypothetical protein
VNYDRSAEFVRKRFWAAVAVGLFTWASWLVSLALGAWDVTGGATKTEAGIDFHLSGTVGPQVWERDILGQIVSPDHLAFYSPARMIREGRAREIYDHERLLDYQQRLFKEGVWQGFEAYRNPPFYALLYVPTSGIPYVASAWLWNGIGLACLALGIHLLGAERPWRAVGWTLTYLPVFTVLSYGQNSLLSFAVLCGTYRLLSAGRPFAAGVLAGLLWFKPPLLLGLILWGLFDLRRLWPAALGTVVGGAMLTGGSWLIVPEAWTGFVETLGKNAEYGNFDWWKMHNPRAFWRLLLPDVPVLPTALWLASAAAGVWLFYRVWRQQRDNLPVVFGAAVLLTLWASPHTMIYEWTLALVPAVLWWTYAPQHRSAWVVLFAVVWVALLTATDVGRAQEWVMKNRLGIDPPVIFQYSVPAIGWAGWRAARLFAGEPVGLEGGTARPVGQPTGSAP